MRSQLLFAAVSCALVSGCLGDLFNLQSDSAEPALDDTPVDIPPSAYPQCFGGDDVMDDQLFVENNFESEPAADFSGREELPLSRQGCIRWFRDVVDGRVVGQGMVKARGLMEAFSEPDGTVRFKEHEVYLSHEVFTANTSRLEIDSNADGQLESVTVDRYDGQGQVERVMTFFADFNKEVERRDTVRRVDSELLRWTTERRVKGELKVTTDAFSPIRMQAQRTASGSCYGQGRWDMPCSAEERKATRKLLLEMLNEARECLGRARWGDEKGLPGSGKDLKVVEHHIKSRGEKILDRCFEGNDAFAEIEGLSKDPFGTKILRVNSGMLRCESRRFIKGKLFHEVLHTTRGSHNSEVVALGDKLSDEAYAYTDSMRACDELCFGEIKTQCSCAACFDTLACDPVCEKLPGCRKYGPDGKTIVMSEAVGALCSMPGGVAAGSHWNNTMASCESSCDGGTCKSFSRSCNPNCN